MADSVDSLKSRTWTRDKYLITTNSTLMSVADVNAAFTSNEMYWASPLPDDAMRSFLEHNLCFGVFCIPQSDSSGPITAIDALPPNTNFIGFGRLMTDFTTMAYLTDVFILPTHQGQGLGGWMPACVQETLSTMPYLRGSMLFTGDWKRSVPLYEEVLGISVVQGRRVEGSKNGGEGFAPMLKTWKGSPLYEEERHKAAEKI
ncbi:related to GNAT family N-acetyltransferase [Rhynchosporium graminicola]|uniref:Related to GNAT family N-acetyltransferase n=1 Tax=Rhynchosporium graminicola TaxID=2792576 RepID=A0A1E1KZY7_9HELO|nr:related to GNAT family N-acetyltransferase [Rhynchosporium commune]